MELEQKAFDTAAPLPAAPSSVWRRWKQRAIGRASETILPLIKRAARPYVSGEQLDDALCVATRLGQEGVASTLGFWDTAADSARDIAASHLAAIDRVSHAGLDSYISLKPPALRFDPARATELASAATAQQVRLHCDSHGTEVADLSNAMLETMLERCEPGLLGTTLPGRWARSPRDADWAVARRLNVRVVKGQWPDPGDPHRDMAAGFLDVVDRLAGRAAHVAVATHDLDLAATAIGRLRAAGTSFELELLFGMPVHAHLRWAKENGVKVRIYVPYGKGFVPNAISLLRHNPRLVWTIAKNHAMARLAGK